MKNNKSKIFVFLNYSVMNLMILVILLNTLKTDIFHIFCDRWYCSMLPWERDFLKKHFSNKVFWVKGMRYWKKKRILFEGKFSPVLIGLNNWYIETKMKLKIKIKLDHVCKIEKENDFLFLLILLYIWANIPFCILMIS